MISLIEKSERLVSQYKCHYLELLVQVYQLLKLCEVFDMVKSAFDVDDEDSLLSLHRHQHFEQYNEQPIL